MNKEELPVIDPEKIKTALDVLNEILKKEEVIQYDERTGVSRGLIADNNVEALRRVISIVKQAKQ